MQFWLQQREAEVAAIRRGIKGELPPDRTFSEICDYMLRTRTRRKRSARHDVSASVGICGRRSAGFASRRSALDDAERDHHTGEC